MKGSHLLRIVFLGLGISFALSHAQLFTNPSEWEEFLQNLQRRQVRQDPSSVSETSQSVTEQLKLVTEYQDDQPLYQKPQPQKVLSNPSLEPIDFDILVPDFAIEDNDYDDFNNDLVEVDEDVIGIVEARTIDQLAKLRLEKLTFDDNLTGGNRPCRASYSLTSFNLASFEGQDTNCTFEVIPSLPSICRLSLEFHHFISSARSGELCTTSGIQIGDGQRKCGNLTGKYEEIRFGDGPIEIQIISEDNANTSNDSSESIEYNITVRQINCAQPEDTKLMLAQADASTSEVTSLRQEQGCNEIYNLEEFIIQSPKYPNQYPASTDCSITVFASDANICFLELRFDEFRLEPSAVSDECANDYLEISDDNDLRQPRRYCGVFTGIRLLEIEGTKRFLFHSNERNNDLGYSIFVKQIQCDDPIPPSSESPARTTPSFNNDDTSSARPDFSTSRPNFSTSTASSTNRPPFVSTTTPNPFFTTFPTLPPSFGTTQNPFFTSSRPSFSSTEHPYFTTPKPNPNPGYFPPIPSYRPPVVQITPTFPPGGARPTFATGKPTFCSRTFVVNNPIRITSPHYPRRYLNEETCEYRVQFTRSDICFLKVNYLNFSLEKSHDCFKDHLLINGNKICGRQVGSVLYPQQGPQAILKFSSDNFGRDFGFDIELSQISCEEQPLISSSTSRPSYITPVPNLPDTIQEIGNSYGSPQSVVLMSSSDELGTPQLIGSLENSAHPIPIRAPVDDISNGIIPISAEYGGLLPIQFHHLQPSEPFAPEEGWNEVLPTARPHFNPEVNTNVPNGRPPFNPITPSERPPFNFGTPSVRPPFNPSFPVARPSDGSVLEPANPTGRPPFYSHSSSGSPPFNPSSSIGGSPYEPRNPTGRPPFNPRPSTGGSLYKPANPTGRPPFNPSIPMGRPPFTPYEPSPPGSTSDSNHPNDLYEVSDGATFVPNQSSYISPPSGSYGAPPSHYGRPTYHRPHRPHGKRKPKLLFPFTKILNSKRKLIHNVLSKLRKPRFFQKHKKNKRPSSGYGVPHEPPLGSGYGAPQGRPIGSNYGVPQGPPVGSGYGIPKGPPLGSSYGAPQSPPFGSDYGMSLGSSNNLSPQGPNSSPGISNQHQGKPNYQPDNVLPLPTARPPFDTPSGPALSPGGSNHFPSHESNPSYTNPSLPTARPPFNRSQLVEKDIGTKLQNEVLTSYDVPIIPGTSNNVGPGFEVPSKPIVNCGTTTQENEFILQSPGYPKDYQNLVDCYFEVIPAPNSCFLHLSLIDFIVEESLGCVEDYLELDGTRVCGQQSGKEVVLSLRQNSWKIPFKSDSRGTCRGFQIAGRQVSCQSEVIPRKPSLQLPNVIESSSCITDVEAIEGTLNGFSKGCTERIVPRLGMCRIDFRMTNLAFGSATCRGPPIEINSVPFCYSPGITSLHDVALNPGSFNPNFVTLLPKSTLSNGPASVGLQRDQHKDWKIEFRQIPC
ncbi:uncharacterized protein LOC131881452 isoform X2 [Tigriopus californicus]|uniref:uncharacterized protein LOC131881452 isoform X2 n=1 Tax=Tigriopus californicus TaxID=6832 RepID=UPI0027D9E1D6|nr:uncharacterized protein LOC131881452 isoform X2 [Tigriopus californicus]